MTVQFPDKLQFLFEPKRYKVAYGGRGGAKSWGFARALLILGASKQLRILCAREIQKSIKDSVHQLLKDQIIALSLESFYSVTNTAIVGKNGTQFGFEGLKHNITNIKSWEGADICWVEEAHTVSKSSWDVLIPTIRKEGSEIWLTFNPELEEDETYQRFVVSPPPDSIITKINWSDNPWFPDTLKQEKDYLKEKDHAAYLNVWEGHCKAAVEGAIFASEMDKASERTPEYPDSRITHVPYDKSKPVDIFYDLGRADKTAMWWVQQIGYEFRILRYYENNGQHFSHYIKIAKELPYAYGRQYLPHDAENEHVSAEKTIKMQVIDAFGPNSYVKIDRIPKKALAIDAARGIFDRCVFDKTLCADGITCLRKYAYKVDETGRVSREPDHDTPWSHGADAFMAIGQSMLPVKKPMQLLHKPQLPRYLTGKI